MNRFVSSLAECPGYEGTGDCYYSPIPDMQWRCPAGNFCLSPDQVEKCTAGFYCPVNTLQPLFCPAGYYCSADTRTVAECPEGYYCPMATVNPLKCWFAISCPAKSQNVSNLLLLVFLPMLLIVLAAAVYIVGGDWSLRRYKRQSKVSNADCTDINVLFPSSISSSTVSRTSNNSLSRQRAGSMFSTFSFGRRSRSDSAIIDIPVEHHPPNEFFKFKDICLRLKQSRRPLILNQVSGCFKSGRLCAIIGPTGSGKSTLLHILGGRLSATSGTIQTSLHLQKQSSDVNDSVNLKKIRRKIGFVPQNDIMLSEMTVYEIIKHECQMKLMASQPPAVINAKVDALLKYLGLAKVTNQVVGNVSKRGVSGGELKRVNIGMELVGDPVLLFLDEPTSGLDSTTATDICRLLKRLCVERNLIVVTVVHSPSHSALVCFDDIMVLSANGRVIYTGPVNEMKTYFGQFGYLPSSDKETVADFAMNLVLGKYGSGTVSKLEEEWASRVSQETNQLPPLPDISEENQPSLPRFTEKRTIWKSITVWCRQFMLLFERALKQQYIRNYKHFIFSQVTYIIAGILISLAVQKFSYMIQQPQSVCEMTPLSIRSKCSWPRDELRLAGMFICMAILYSGITAGCNTFGNEKVCIRREYYSGSVSTVAYFVTKALADLPRIAIAALLFTYAFLFFFEYHSSISHLLIIFMLLFLIAFAMGYFVAAAFPSELHGAVCTGFSLAWALVLSGVFPYLEEVHTDYPYLEWLWNISPSRHAIEAFWLSEMQNRSFIIDRRNVFMPFAYVWDNFENSCLRLMFIYFGWLLIAFLVLRSQLFLLDK